MYSNEIFRRGGIANVGDGLFLRKHWGGKINVRMGFGISIVPKTEIAGYSAFDAIFTEIRTLRFPFFKKVIILGASNLILSAFETLADSTLFPIDGSKIS